MANQLQVEPAVELAVEPEVQAEPEQAPFLQFSDREYRE
jgi:hypothetical protein